MRGSRARADSKGFWEGVTRELTKGGLMTAKRRACLKEKELINNANVTDRTGKQSLNTGAIVYVFSDQCRPKRKAAAASIYTTSPSKGEANL